MELSEARPYGNEGTGRKPTRDFLSLYSHSTAQQDPRPPSQGSYLKTHDFLQPPERVKTKATAKEKATVEISSMVQKPPPRAPPLSVEHLLPGVIGTYRICHISDFNNNQRVPKPEAYLFNVPQATSTDRNDDNSNCSSYTSTGFTLWEESAVKRAKTGKENDVRGKPILGESAAKLGQPTLTEQSSSNNRYKSSNSLSSSQTTGQKNQSFIEMMKSAKDCAPHEELDNEEAFILNKESSNPHRAELRVKVDGKSTNQKPNTPRSKHSATEQRRRSKINDRFQMLRELIPQSDQKRDKAAFLLERNNHRPAESFEPHGTNSGSGPSSTLLFASKVDEKNITITPTTHRSSQNIESGLSTATALKAMDQHPGITNKSMPIPLSSHPNFFTPTQSGGAGGVVSQLTPRLKYDAESGIYQASGQCQTYTCSTDVTAASDKLKEKELTSEGGAIGISSVYSKGLLDTLTQALQSSGVDLSQASISVQIELGKQADIRATVPMCGAKDDEVHSSSQGMMRSRDASSEKSDQAVKKLKMCKS